MTSFVEKVKRDLPKSKKVECSWEFNDGKSQMTSTLVHAKGQTTVYSDLAPFMGGSGLAPDPIQYCLFGLATCFAGTFMSTATMMGIEIKTLKVSAENSMDFSKSIGLTNNPITEKVSSYGETVCEKDDWPYAGNPSRRCGLSFKACSIFSGVAGISVMRIPTAS